jgi:hypothetical protein
MNKFSLSALVSACVLIAAPTHAADVAAGKAKAEDSCVEEYQADVRAKTSKDPKGAAKMTKEAKKLSAADVANVAAYYASLK